jgi:hypothetical protein
MRRSFGNFLECLPSYSLTVKAATALVSALLVAGCASGATTSRHVVTNSASTQTTASPSPRTSPSSVAGSISIIDHAGPPPLILSDTSPNHLAASVYLSVGGYDAPSRNVTELAISFSSQGRLVQLVADESVTCNGIALPRGGGTFDVKVSTDTFAGKRVTCTYRSGRSLGTIAFTAPVAPAILSPHENVEIARSTRTAVTFRIGGHSTMFYVIALGRNSKAWSEPVGTTPTQALLDTSAFLPGPGFVAMNQFFDLPDLHGTGFQSVDAQGQATEQISVTWI